MQVTQILNDRFADRPVRRILLVSPPDVDLKLFDFSTTRRGRSNNYPPYGLGVIARHLLNHGYQTQICNLNHEVLVQCRAAEEAEDFDFEAVWQQKLARDFNEFQPDLIGITCLFSVTHQSLVNVCQAIKKLNPAWRDDVDSIPLALGGVHVTHDPDRILDEIPEADFAFLHEAELSFLNFLEVINGKQPETELSQLIVNAPGARLKIEQEARPEPADLNLIPAFELMDIPDYSRVGTLGSWYGFVPQGTPIATALANRGCRAACTFCNVRTFNGVGVRQRSVDSVLDELTQLKEVYGVGHIIWLDDDLLYDPKDAIELFNGMVRRNLNMTWDATNGVIAYSCCKEEVIAAAAASGCIGIHLGVESGNPDILKDIKKPGTVDTFLKSAEVLRKFEQINARILLIIGFPDETLRMIFDTIHLAEEMQLDWCNIAILQPWKSTPIYDAMVEKGLLGEQEGTLKSKNSKIAPYNLGPYSRQRAIERGKIEQTAELKERFEGLELDAVPTPDQLDDIWFYMNYRLNFSRLFKQKKPVKLEQQRKFLRYVHTLSAPDNALVMYFYGLIQHRLEGKVQPELIQKLQDRLSSSQYWDERFAMLGLEARHLENGRFPDDKEIPLKLGMETPVSTSVAAE